MIIYLHIYIEEVIIKSTEIKDTVTGATYRLHKTAALFWHVRYLTRLNSHSHKFRDEKTVDNIESARMRLLFLIKVS